MSAFSSTSIGVLTEPQEFVLESQAGKDYTQATNDPIQAHLDGTLIPPIYCVVPVWEQVFRVVSDVVPEEHFFSVVHGEQDMYFHAPLSSGMTLRSDAKGECISVKDSGTTLVVSTRSYDTKNDQLVVEQFFTMFFRGVDGGVDVGNPHIVGLDTQDYLNIVEQDDDSPTFVSKTISHMDDDQTIRYAKASGDYMPIHIDDEFAKSVGLPGIIIHGLCTMAHASWAAITSVANGDPTKLSRIAVRFSKPLRPGDDLVTRTFWWSDLPKGAKRYYLSSKRLSDGAAILTNALVEVDV